MEIPPQEPNAIEIFEKDLNSEWNQKFKSSSVIAVDTEAMGLIHGRDRLCLVQICDSEDNVACIKIHLGQKNAPNLKELFESTYTEKVFHYARFDVAALASGLGIQTQSIFCTKIASKLARTYTPRHGLKDLVLELTGVELNKQAQSSDWGKTERLTSEQMIYAANDVRYLIKVRSQLKQMLNREGRMDLAQKCFNCIPVMSALDRSRFTNIFDH